MLPRRLWLWIGLALLALVLAGVVLQAVNQLLWQLSYWLPGWLIGPLLLLVLTAACVDQIEPPLSYGRCNPGEVCGLRTVDIERDKAVWTWRPTDHKNAWRKKPRVIMIGPKAQAILRRYLVRPAVDYCFSPAESERQRSKVRRLARESPLTPSQRARKPKANGRRRPRDHYDNASYRRAISRGVVALNKARLAEDPKVAPIEDWAPNRLRHTAGTEVRKKFGLEAAQVVLGHAQADVTQIYAEADLKLAAKVSRKIG
jgi:integrase